MNLSVEGLSPGYHGCRDPFHNYFPQYFQAYQPQESAFLCRDLYQGKRDRTNNSRQLLFQATPGRIAIRNVSWYCWKGVADRSVVGAVIDLFEIFVPLFKVQLVIKFTLPVNCSFFFFRFKWKGVFASVGGLLGISFVVTGVIIDYYDLKVVLFGMGE